MKSISLFIFFAMISCTTPNSQFSSMDDAPTDSNVNDLGSSDEEGFRDDVEPGQGDSGIRVDIDDGVLLPDADTNVADGQQSDIGFEIDRGVPSADADSSQADANPASADVAHSIPDANRPVLDAALPESDAALAPDALRPTPDAQPFDPDAAPPPSPRDVDNDGDGFTENQGDCDDRNNAVYPNALELCHDRLDNDCNGTADQIDSACMLPDTTLSVGVRGAYDALELNVETYSNVANLGIGWQETGRIFNQDTVTVILDSVRYPPDVLCGIRFNLTLWSDQNDVNGEGQIVGEPNGWLCNTVDGEDILNQAIIRFVRLNVLGAEVETGNMTTISFQGEDGCSALLILNAEGPCAF